MDKMGNIIKTRSKISQQADFQSFLTLFLFWSTGPFSILFDFIILPRKNRFYFIVDNSRYN